MSNKEKMEQLRTIFEEVIKTNKYPQSMRNIIKAASAAKENEDKVDLCRSLDTGTSGRNVTQRTSRIQLGKCGT